MARRKALSSQGRFRLKRFERFVADRRLGIVSEILVLGGWGFGLTLMKMSNRGY